MAKAIKKNEPDPRTVYADIIDLPHWQSPSRPHMSLYDRAAQFAPFAALTGYEDMVDEEARTVDRKIELDESAIEELNRKLNQLAGAVARGEHPPVSLTYFVPDPLKSGGAYETITEEVKSIDASRGTIVLMKTQGHAGRNVEIQIDELLDIHFSASYGD